MSNHIQILANAVKARVVTEDRDIKMRLSQLLSYVIEGAEFNNAFKSGNWNGRSSFFTYNSASFPAGFVQVVADDLRKMGFNVQIARKPFPAPLGPVNLVVDSFAPDPRYDYQDEAVGRLLRLGQMTVQVATGGGKSRIAKKAVARIRRPTLFLTTRSVLMHQMKRGFEEAGFKVGVIGDGIWAPVRGVNVGMVQTLQSRLRIPSEPLAAAELQKLIDDRRRTIKLLQYFEFLILEEAHEAGGEGYYDICNHALNAVYRMSLTATPFMRPDAEANMRLMAVTGPVGIQISEELLIARGIWATPTFKYIPIPAAHPKLRKTSAWSKAYRLGIVESPTRNAEIYRETYRDVQYGISTLISVLHKAHGKELLRMFLDKGIKAAFIFGEHNQKERIAALKAIETGEIQVLIGSNILDVGIDVPSLGKVILAGGGKAEVAIRQRIGRGCRSKKDGINCFFVVDFEDTSNNHLRDHSRQRRAIVEQTPGFGNRILKPGEDFDYSPYALAKAS